MFLPDGWVREPLVRHIDFPQGQVDPRRSPYRHLPLIAPDHIESHTGRLLLIQTAVEQNAISGKYAFKGGDVLYSKIRPYLRKATLAAFEGLCSADMYPLRPKSSLDSRFLLALVLGEDFSRFAEAVSMRSGFPKINREEFAEHEAVLPPIDEQRRIADVLDAADVAIRQTEAVITKLRQMKAGLLRDLLTCGLDKQGRLRDPQRHPQQFKDTPLGRIPNAWDIHTLAKLAEVGSGVTLGRDVQGATVVELPYLRVANVQDGYLDLSEVKTVRVYQSEVSNFLLAKGDVLMTEGGDYDKLGRGTVWRGQVVPCLHQNHIFRVRAIREKLLPDFLALVSASHIGKTYFLRSSKQTTNLASINSTQLKAFPIPCPTIEEQRAMVAVTQAVDARIESEKAHDNKLTIQKHGLMHDLLTGRVRV